MKKILFTCWLLIASISFGTIAQEQKSIFDTSSSSLFSNDDEFLKVDEAFIFNFHQKNNQLKISFDIAEGYYLYRHQFRFTPKNATISEVVLPTGTDHEDEYFGIQKVFTEQLSFTIDLESTADAPKITIRYQGCAEKGLCYAPKKQTIDLNALKASETANSVASALKSSNTQSSSDIQSEKSEQNQLADMLKQDSLWLTLLAFFVGGLLLSFTPCVFPMYPILTGIIVGQGDGLTTKKAFTLSFFYVQGMAITYTALGIVVALAGAQFQAAFQHPALLVGLSVLFIFLALSMFGVFNLALPASWQNKLNNMSNKQKGGSIAGVTTMGVISGLVASPCTTAPLTGALLYISQTGDVVLGASALYALSLGMGLPLLILGSSGGKLLPKAGAWMNVIKNIFGLLLLAVPVFLLERIIPAMATQVLWSLLLLAAAGYFYVENQKSPSGFWFGLRAILIFVMIFFGAKQFHQLVFPTTNNVEQSQELETTGFVMVASLEELQETVKTANKAGKSVMVDLYADWCVACKEFEHYTFSAPQVQKALSNSVWVQVDLTDTGTETSVELMDHFEVFGLPSILFFDTKGNELSNHRVTGFMDADNFTAHVKKILP